MKCVLRFVPRSPAYGTTLREFIYLTVFIKTFYFLESAEWWQIVFGSEKEVAEKQYQKASDLQLTQ